MLHYLRWLERLFGFKARGVVHIGAHYGDEKPLYDALGIRRQLYIEAHPTTFRRLEQNIHPSADVALLNIACGSAPGHATMHELAGNDGASNSLLEPTRHLECFPDIVPAGTVDVEVKPLDNILPSAGLRPDDYNLLVLDVQGFELEVLRGSQSILDCHTDAVVCEISRYTLYRDACLVDQVDDFMRQHGFRRVLTHWMRNGWGDGLYLREAPTLGLRARRAILSAFGNLALCARLIQNEIKVRLSRRKPASVAS